MKYFVIEISKPLEENYTERLAQKVAEGDFEIVGVSESEEEVQAIQVRFQIANVKNQSGLHYEILPENSNHHLLAKSIKETPKQLLHGGKREGAGRKSIGKEPKVAFPVSRVSADVADIVRKHENMTEFVEQAIRFYHASLS